MKKSKTDRYYIEFSANETLESIPIELSKTAFDKHMREYKRIASEHPYESDDENSIYTFAKHFETEKLNINRYYFNLGLADIVLVHEQTKAGYCFK